MGSPRGRAHRPGCGGPAALTRLNVFRKRRGFVRQLRDETSRADRHRPAPRWAGRRWRDGRRGTCALCANGSCCRFDGCRVGGPRQDRSSSGLVSGRDDREPHLHPAPARSWVCAGSVAFEVRCWRRLMAGRRQPGTPDEVPRAPDRRERRRRRSPQGLSSVQCRLADARRSPPRWHTCIRGELLTRRGHTRRHRACRLIGPAALVMPTCPHARSRQQAASDVRFGRQVRDVAIRSWWFRQAAARCHTCPGHSLR